MNFFGGSQVSEITKIIKLICDESIPGEEIELNKAFELIDDLKSRKLKVEDFQISWVDTFNEIEKINELDPTSYNKKIWECKLLSLLQLCVKNCGIVFISKLFFINNDNKDKYLLNPILRTFHNRLKNNNSPPSFNSDVFLNLIQFWFNVFSSQLVTLKNDPLQNNMFSIIKDILSPIASLRQDLLSSKVGLNLSILQHTQSSNFDVDTTDFNENFLKTEAPPEWLDSDTCMICNSTFSTLNRQHHCRKCGGAFCGQHSNNFRLLPSLGFNEQVRVCDTCVAELDHKKDDSSKRSGDGGGTHKSKLELLDQKQMELALANSLKDFQMSNNQEPSHKEFNVNTTSTAAMKDKSTNQQAQIDGNDEDEDFKRAIELSLKEAELEKQRKQYVEDNYNSADSTTGFSNSNTTTNEMKKIAVPTTNASQPYVDSKLLDHELQSRITGKEVESIQLFSQLMTNLSQQRQQGDVLAASSINNPELQGLFVDIIKLKSKLNKNINEDFNSYDALIDFQSKLNTVTRLYDDLLQKRLTLRNNHSMVSNQPHPQQRPQSVSNPLYQQTYAQPVQPQYTSTSHSSQIPAFNPTYERPTNINASSPQQQSVTMDAQYTGIAPKYEGISPQFTGTAPQFTGMAPQFASMIPQFTGMAPQYTGMAPQYTGMTSQYKNSTPPYSNVTPQYTGIAHQHTSASEPSQPPVAGVSPPLAVHERKQQSAVALTPSEPPEIGASTQKEPQPASAVILQSAKAHEVQSQQQEQSNAPLPPATSADPFQNVSFPQVPSTNVLQSAPSIPECNAVESQKEEEKEVKEVPMLIEL